MTWGAFYMYYACPKCGKKFKYAIDLLDVAGEQFGQCPNCKLEGTFIKEGPNTPDSLEYEEVDEQENQVIKRTDRTVARIQRRTCPFFMAL